ncbi:Hsp20/alpha crystallin family protein [Mameliella sp. AT18]|uniref:Hsp20/alpha crystallin family protein n=1 Tax=Mameliella sp. AT18 TaxID=3028385 RepID=UPI00237A159B|nr:Hsp20/alpha crystallin family protein [Mameliella sp. AT18]MDD9731281.1 Hsp20/alpha crystallin family protein [Mameliella sp. AT18]
MSKDKSKIEVRQDKHATAPAQAEGWSPLVSLRHEIDRLFDDFGAGSWRHPLSRRMQSMFPASESWFMSPATEVVDCDGEYRITAELPGMTADDIEIKLNDGTITIRGEKSEEKKEEKEDYLLSERRYGSFQRSVPLPSGIDPDKVAASVANGVLTVTLPKSEEAKQKERKIEVKAA